MAIMRMKHLQVIALKEDNDAILYDMAKSGAIEVSPAKESNRGDELPSVTDKIGQLRAQKNEIDRAKATLLKYAKVKRGMFAKRTEIHEKEFFKKSRISEALSLADEINSDENEINQAVLSIARLKSKKQWLIPWRNIDLPLESVSEGKHFLSFGTIPAGHDISAVESSLCDAVESAVFEYTSSDKEFHYLLVIAHCADEEKLLDELHKFSFSKVTFPDTYGTASKNIADIEAEIARLATGQKEITKKLAKKGEAVKTLEIAQDALSACIERAEAQKRLSATAQTVVLTGWFPEREEKRVVKLLDKYGAAYEIRDPNDDETPPTLTYNSKLVAPYEMVTNMYSPPTYREADPNPVMAPFFAVFFGIMFSDAAYGILLTFVGAIVLRKMKPRGGLKKMMSIAVMCGITTFIWGVLFGGFFGDAIPTVYKMITGEEFAFDLALWFNPLDDPMLMLVFSFALGGIHIFAGMAMQAYLMIRDGLLLDAIFDIGSWWVLFGGIIFALLGNTQAGLVLIAVGALALLLTQGRHEKNIFKKITKGLSSLYSITSYLGDILSYSRLLALSLATAVIASVINAMGAMTGPIGFIIVFLVGHTFNIAVNLIGTYVHTARLQYVEFFGKFYQGGGDLFSPLDIKTKYVDIIKEEK